MAVENRPANAVQNGKHNIFAILRSNFGTYSTGLKDVAQCLREAENTASLLESQIVSLQNEQQRLFLRISHCKSLLAPIRRPPPELLVRIFDFCCTESKVDATMSCPVVKLSQVCAGWRELVRTTSSLWARIAVDLNKSGHSVEQILLMIKTHLTLSKQSPLHITLVLPSAVTDDALVVIRAFIPHSMRWETVSLDVDRSHLLDPEFATIKGRLPLLRQLEVWPPSPVDIEIPDNEATVDSFISAPVLRSFKLGTDTQTKIEVPWPQLHDLTLWGHKPIAISKLLRSASAARKVTIEHCYSPDAEDSKPEPVVYNMASLTICVDHWDRNPTVFLRPLTLPQLTSLCLSGAEPMYPDTDFCFSDIQAFLIRSGCILTSLSLVNLSNTDHVILEILECIPSLVELIIHERPIQDHSQNTILTPYFVGQLSFNHDRKSFHRFLPRLKTVSFQVHGRAPLIFVISSFVAMVRSRWIPNLEHATEMGVNCLRNVELRFIGLMENAERELVEINVRSLTMLRAAGLYFEMSRRDYAKRSSY
ncbi:hypothetical protein D9758_011812 [Tetrapyrgos nigripes]|uniref:F-box domain-containing protein n=1 Tax=Tetrapyrgos nigripes TaxID=182062 RepID=A0A8H5FNX2_9AGAR|nr:hypothetical protein D9758_011812 [Tetrapyrgos nigripes]